MLRSENLITPIATMVPLRKEPSHSSEMVSQVLLGEYVEKLKEVSGEWIRVKCTWDGYEGWVVESNFEKKDFDKNYVFINENVSFGQDYEMKLLPIGCKIPFQIFRVAFEEKPFSRVFSPDNLVEFAKLFLGTPYLWGGRCGFGIDCSGLVQISFAQFAIVLPRDAWMQELMGFKIEENFQKGDLAFFSNENNKVTHVGILLSPNSILHASGMVRIDDFKIDGIYHKSKGHKTHHLYSVKRILG
jgi:gamma-D-glutamyl-L-lysine dipeptidyl-peptidase